MSQGQLEDVQKKAHFYFDNAKDLGITDKKILDEIEGLFKKAGGQLQTRLGITTAQDDINKDTVGRDKAVSDYRGGIEEKMSEKSKTGTLKENDLDRVVKERIRDDEQRIGFEEAVGHTENAKELSLKSMEDVKESIDEKGLKNGAQNMVDSFEEMKKMYLRLQNDAMFRDRQGISSGVAGKSNEGVLKESKLGRAYARMEELSTDGEEIALTSNPTTFEGDKKQLANMTKSMSQNADIFFHQIEKVAQEGWVHAMGRVARKPFARGASGVVRGINRLLHRGDEVIVQDMAIGRRVGGYIKRRFTGEAQGKIDKLKMTEHGSGLQNLALKLDVSKFPSETELGTRQRTRQDLGREIRIQLKEMRHVARATNRADLRDRIDDVLENELRKFYSVSGVDINDDDLKSLKIKMETIVKQFTSAK
jgi:hypothetical protein